MFTLSHRDVAFEQIDYLPLMCQQSKVGKRMGAKVSPPGLDRKAWWGLLYSPGPPTSQAGGGHPPTPPKEKFSPMPKHSRNHREGRDEWDALTAPPKHGSNPPTSKRYKGRGNLLFRSVGGQIIQK